MNDPIFSVQLYQSQIAALQMAGQHYLKCQPDTSLHREIESGIEALDAPYTLHPMSEARVVRASL